MGFKSIGKRFARSGVKAAEGVEHFIQTTPKQITKNTEIDLYLNDFKCLRPKLKKL